MLLPLGTHRHIEPIGLASFTSGFSTTVPFGSSPARASRTSDFLRSALTRARNVQRSGKDSNLQLTADGR